MPNCIAFSGRIELKRPEPSAQARKPVSSTRIEVARSQEARLLELRAATDLARLWRDSGSARDASLVSV